MINGDVWFDSADKVSSEELFRFLSESKGIYSVECMSPTNVKGSHIGCTMECSEEMEDEYVTYVASFDGAYLDSKNERLYDEYIPGVTDSIVGNGRLFYCSNCKSFGAWMEDVEEVE